jgi:hypothetical protein
MNDKDRPWTRSGLGETAYAALAEGLPASELWSLLLSVVEQRAQRTTAALHQQWQNDRFVRPSYIDQRTLVELDSHLLAAATAFEPVELSPLAPLGVCASVSLGSQNRVVSTIRGTEVVSDPTNVLALESARRLRADPESVVKLATSHRCVRAQEVPKMPGFAATFRMFCMTTSGHERKDQGFVTAALLEHVQTHLRALDRLEQHGYAFPDRSLRILVRPEREALGQRLATSVTQVPVTIEALEHRYYDGVRFMLSARSTTGAPIPLIDGGAFDWLHKLASNHKMVFVASAIGAQLAAYLYRPGHQPDAQP